MQDQYIENNLTGSSRTEYTSNCEKHNFCSNRRCRIISTIGPGSDISGLLEAGTNAFRINFSHGNYDDYESAVDTIRNLERKHNIFIPIIADLQGPKIRIGDFEQGGIALQEGCKLNLRFNKMGAAAADEIYLPHAEIMRSLQPGDKLKLDDGTISLIVTDKINDETATVEVLNGGYLTNRKGVNLPGRSLPISALTDKDKQDINFALEHGFDVIALSFVQHAQDVIDAKKLLKGQARILAKIEKPLAIETIDKIVEVADIVMVARGDLGVELPLEQVPPIQRHIVQVCRRAGKPVIIATQMLQSMIDAPSPTRAEASDVAAAVYMGVDAVMLSAESAVGNYPQEAVSVMDRIIKAVENDETYWENTYDRRKRPIATVANALCASARDIARVMPIKAILAFTCSGSTAFAAARERSRCPIYGLTPHVTTARSLGIVWGVVPVLSPDTSDSDSMIKWAEEFAKQQLSVSNGDNIIVMAGTPFGVSGTTNMLKIVTIN